MLPDRCKAMCLEMDAAMLLAAVKAAASMLATVARTGCAATGKTALTDAPARPAANENHLLISAYTTHPQSPLLAVTRRISDSRLQHGGRPPVAQSAATCP